MLKEWIRQIAKNDACDGVEFGNVDLLKPKIANRLAKIAQSKGLKVALKNNFTAVREGSIDVDLYYY